MKLPKGYGFGNAAGGMGGMMQQALQRAQNMDEELAEERVELEQNGCKATFDGRGMILSLQIDPALIDPSDKESLEDVLVGVIRAGFEKSTTLRDEKVREIMPNIPGLGL